MQVLFTARRKSERPDVLCCQARNSVGPSLNLTVAVKAGLLYCLHEVCDHPSAQSTIEHAPAATSRITMRSGAYRALTAFGLVGAGHSLVRCLPPGVRPDSHATMFANLQGGTFGSARGPRPSLLRLLILQSEQATPTRLLRLGLHMSEDDDV
ncbi:hypothetical protein OH76DRAFT_279688 [Lentinus brumalis]|uniref:Uncharacterized protein n=1 Tax=Lentinus brumalis TaxID=2498619 RepID=A0A371CKX2_9APHY|nr:hypothetical protein OH76DRAFT_279688 [Polyporus brumalis]